MVEKMVRQLEKRSTSAGHKIRLRSDVAVAVLAWLRSDVLRGMHAGIYRSPVVRRKLVSTHRVKRVQLNCVQLIAGSSSVCGFWLVSRRAWRELPRLGGIKRSSGETPWGKSLSGSARGGSVSG